MWISFHFLLCFQFLAFFPYLNHIYVNFVFSGLFDFVRVLFIYYFIYFLYRFFSILISLLFFIFSIFSIFFYSSIYLLTSRYFFNFEEDKAVKMFPTKFKNVGKKTKMRIRKKLKNLKK